MQGLVFCTKLVAFVGLNCKIIRTSKYPPKVILTNKQGIALTLVDIPSNYILQSFKALVL
jgi:hypothetical protein